MLINGAYARRDLTIITGQGLREGDMLKARN
jgi:hypothetical protein